MNYHADNGRFQGLGFKEDCHHKWQQLRFFGVNAHFKNGKAEKIIRDLQDVTHTSLLHSIQKWPHKSSQYTFGPMSCDTLMM
jgi:hypothetical protein